MSYEINNLISLLGDSDTEVHYAVTKELLRQGLEVIPKLEKVWENTQDLVMQERLENVIHYIQFTNTRESIKKWIDDGAEDIVKGASIIAQLQYPEATYTAINAEFEKIAGDIYLSSGNHLTAIEKIKLLNYVVFEVNNFTRNTSNLYTPQNSFINQVLATRKGDPVSIGIVYLAVAHKIGLPVYGVNLPNCFVLAYINEYRHAADKDITNDILFYINPYNKGAVLNRREIDSFIKHQNLDKMQEYYVPCHNSIVIMRLIVNLILAYEKMGFEDRAEPLKKLLKDFNPDNPGIKN